MKAIRFSQKNREGEGAIIAYSYVFVDLVSSGNLVWDTVAWECKLSSIKFRDDGVGIRIKFD